MAATSDLRRLTSHTRAVARRTHGLDVGGSLEVGQAREVKDLLVSSYWITAGSAFLATPTPFGPGHIALGLAEESDPTPYPYLGRVLP